MVSLCNVFFATEFFCWQFIIYNIRKKKIELFLKNKHSSQINEISSSIVKGMGCLFYIFYFLSILSFIYNSEECVVKH